VQKEGTHLAGLLGKADSGAPKEGLVLVGGGFIRRGKGRWKDVLGGERGNGVGGPDGFWAKGLFSPALGEGLGLWKKALVDWKKKGGRR